MVGKGGGVAKCSLLGCAEGCGNGVSGYAGDCGVGVGDNFAVLNVETLDFVEGTRGSAGGGEELVVVKLVEFLAMDGIEIKTGNYP